AEAPGPISSRPAGRMGPRRGPIARPVADVPVDNAAQTTPDTLPAAPEPEPRAPELRRDYDRPFDRNRRNGFNRGRNQGSNQAPAPPAQQPQALEAPRSPETTRQNQPPAQRGSVESLIARQNVLFEDFTQHQTQVLQELQRTVQNLAGRGAGTV